MRHAACGFLTPAIPSYTAAKRRAYSDLYAGRSNEHHCNMRRVPELDFVCVSKDRLIFSHSSHVHRAIMCKVEGFFPAIARDGHHYGAGCAKQRYMHIECAAFQQEHDSQADAAALPARKRSCNHKLSSR